MGIAFVCDKEDRQYADDPRHETSIAMVRCSRCRKHAVGGYLCDTCGRADVDPPDQLWGHGEGKCELSESDED